MFNLVSNPFVIVLLFLVPVVAFLGYLCATYKIQINYLIVEVKNGKNKIKYWKDYADRKEKERKLYTFESPTDRIENVIQWRGDDQHLRLTLVGGSLYVVSTPAEYKLIIQDQSEENKSENL